MAYATTSCADIAAMLTFIRNTCTANGWTLAGNVLYKGNCYVEIIADGSVGLRIRGGTGIDGSNNLTGACGQYAWIGTIAGIALAYPLQAEGHVYASPDECYFVFNYSVSYYQMLAFGISDVQGLAGTGVWFHASRSTNQGVEDYSIGADGITCSINWGYHPDGFALFSAYDGSPGSNTGGTNNSFIHHNLDGDGWSVHDGLWPNAFRYYWPLLAIQPNSWNSEAILLPYTVYFPRPSSKHSLVADLKNIRMTRNTFTEPGDIVTLGTDKWKLYPCFRKSVTTPGGGTQLNHSGTFSYAIRYTGP